MKNNKKSLAIIFTIILILVVGGVYLYSKKVETPEVNSSISRSAFGFNFTVPQGWNIWEGASAGADLLAEPNFFEIMQKGPTAEDSKSFQNFMNNWSVNNAKTITFTNADLDHKNRDFIVVGKIMSIPIDSLDILKLGAINMSVSPQTVNQITAVNNAEKEYKNITIGDVTGTYLRLKKDYKLVDEIFIQVPVDTNGDIHSLLFQEVVKKDDVTALDRMVSFISSLNIKSNN